MSKTSEIKEQLERLYDKGPTRSNLTSFINTMASSKMITEVTTTRWVDILFCGKENIPVVLDLIHDTLCISEAKRNSSRYPVHLVSNGRILHDIYRA